MNKLKFSIVTAVRNEVNSIVTTLKSVQEQQINESSFNIEHIIIDGLSNDGSTRLISSFINNVHSDRLTYNFISEADKGIYDAMNKGRGLATGDFVFFLNAGDSFSHDTVLKKFCESIILIGDLNLLFYGSVNITSELANWQRPVITPPSEIHRICNVNLLPHHQSIFYPRVFYANSEYDTSFIKYGDADYTLRACKQLEAVYLPFKVSSVVLGGFSSKKHSLREVDAIYLDFRKLSQKHSSEFSKLEKMLQPLFLGVKFLLDKIGGSKLKHLAMKIFALQRDRNQT